MGTLRVEGSGPRNSCRIARPSTGPSALNKRSQSQWAAFLFPREGPL